MTQHRTKKIFLNIGSIYEGHQATESVHIINASEITNTNKNSLTKQQKLKVIFVYLLKLGISLYLARSRNCSYSRCENGSNAS